MLGVGGAAAVTGENDAVAAGHGASHQLGNLGDLREQRGIGQDRLLDSYRFLDTASQLLKECFQGYPPFIDCGPYRSTQAQGDRHPPPHRMVAAHRARTT